MLVENIAGKNNKWLLLPNAKFSINVALKDMGQKWVKKKLCIC
jgi:hypothetical protein